MKGLIIICALWIQIYPVLGQTADTGDSPGQKRYVNVEQILILGNDKTRSEVILREMSVSAGDTVNLLELPEKLSIDKRNINNTRLFNTVETDIIEVTYEKVYVLIKVTERWYTFPAPILELVDRNFNDWWVNKNRDLSRINYGLRLYQRNLRGKNETLRLVGQLGYTRQAGISYLIPYLDKGQKNGLQVIFSFSENNNFAYQTNNHLREFVDSDQPVYNNTRAKLTYTRRNSFYDYHYVTAGFERNFASTELLELNPDFFGRDNQSTQKYFYVQYAYRRDKRDVIAYPLSGYLIDANISQSGLGIFTDVNYLTVTSKFSGFKTLGRNFFLANHTALYYNNNRQLSYNNYFGLGYSGFFVRGYELNLIEGDRIFLNKTTFKKRIFSNTVNIKNMPIDQFQYFPIQIYLKSYFDMGYARNFPNYEMNSSYSDRLIYGGGFGLDFVTAYDVVVRVEYSFNDLGMNGLYLHLKKEF